VEKCHSLRCKPNDNIDDAAAFKLAIDSGASTIYFPTGAYIITKTILCVVIQKARHGRFLFILFSTCCLAVRTEGLDQERLNVNG